MDIKKLQKEIHRNAKDKGFWAIDGINDALTTKLLLIITEVCEAVEADREGRWASLELFNRERQASPFHEKSATADAFKLHVKDTVEDELADVFIRLLDVCENYQIDIEKHVRIKMDYNRQREVKHGNKRY